MCDIQIIVEEWFKIKTKINNETKLSKLIEPKSIIKQAKPKQKTIFKFNKTMIKFYELSIIEYYSLNLKNKN